MTRYRLSTLFIVITAVAIAIAIGIEMNKSEITAYILVRRGADDPFAAFTSDDDNLSEDEYVRYIASVKEMLRSKTLLTRALRDPTLSPWVAAHGKDAVEWLQENLKIDTPSDGELVRIRLYHSDPDDGVKLVRAVIDTYFKEIVERDILSAARAEEKLAQLYDLKKAAVLREGATLNTLAASLKIVGDVGDEGLARYPEFIVKQHELKRQIEELDEMGTRLNAAKMRRQAPPRVQKLDDPIVTP